MSTNYDTTAQAKTLVLRAGVRYWEDSTVNGIKDEDGLLIPFRERSNWCPIIDLDNGIVQHWPKGTIADIHYKVCDQCSWTILDGDGAEIYSREDGYVPNILCPRGGGYGDYIIMTIGPNGAIEGWKNTDVQGLFDSKD